jgi:hypothetical protein
MVREIGVGDASYKTEELANSANQARMIFPSFAPIRAIRGQKKPNEQLSTQ